MIDAARADAFSAYGYHRGTTPNFDRFARQGVLFDSAFSTSSWTAPALASLFTGLYPTSHGVGGRRLGLSPKLPTLAGCLESLGYVTAAFSNTPHVSRKRGFDQGFQYFIEMWGGQFPTPPSFLRAIRASLRLAAFHGTRNLIRDKFVNRLLRRFNGTRTTTRLAIEWLTNHAKEEPFFLFIHFLEPHDPYDEAPASIQSKVFRQSRWTDSERERVLAVCLDPHLFNVGKIPLTEHEMELLRGFYLSEIAFADVCLGHILRQMERLGLLDNTYIIVTSDHGECLGEHSFIGHSFFLYDELIRIPLAIRYPWRCQKQSRIDVPVQLIDIWPTILGIAGHEAYGSSSQGRSLLSMDSDAGTPRYVFAEHELPVYNQTILNFRHPGFNDQDFRYGYKVIQVGFLKLVRRSDGVERLYDLKRATGESVDLSSERPEAARAMAQALSQFEQSLAPPPDSGFESWSDTVIAKRLRALGYLE